MNPNENNDTKGNNGLKRSATTSTEINTPSEKKQKVSGVKNENGVSESKNVALSLPKGDNEKAKSNKNTSNTGNSSNKTNSKTQTDPNKMQDVLFSAGVDIKEEEALLNTTINTSKSQAKSNDISIPKHLPFLHPDQVYKFMKKVSEEQNFNTNYLANIKNNNNSDILNMISTACETYMKDIVTNSLVISRHRRKGVKLNTGRRSEISIALKSLAMAQKKEEEKRLKKRIALGLEKEDLENKIDSEETLHRASNVTAGLRAGSKKQYGWLTSSVSKPTSATVKSAGKVANEISSRGDTGLIFREAREEPGIVMRDLLYALESRRNGTQNAITKGYARIRD